MYQFTEGIDHTTYFLFEKHIIKNLNWAMLTTASKAVYPVIRCFAGKNGIAYPSEETIAALCGRDEKIARAGLEGLKDFYGMQMERYITSRGHRSRKFMCKVPKFERGKVFPFHRSILDKGQWAMMKPTAQALYAYLGVQHHFVVFYADFTSLFLQTRTYESGVFLKHHPACNHLSHGRCFPSTRQGPPKEHMARRVLSACMPVFPRHSPGCS